MTKKHLFLSLLILAILFAVALPASFAQGGNNGNGNGRGWGGNGGQPANGGQGYLANLPAASTIPLTEEAIAAMTAGIQDEYNAYVAYGQIMATFGNVRPFTQIQRSEAQHIAAWEALFTRYGLTVPVQPETVSLPVFATISEACEFAQTAEINNMALYDEMLATFAPYPDLTWVATNLRNASQYNHLPAFEWCATR